MLRFTRNVLPAALLLLALAAVPAAAHEGDPHYRSVVRTIEPSTDGLSAQVLDHDDALQMVNKSDRTVVVLDPEGEPYARLMADGTVQVNRASSLARERDDDAPATDDESAGLRPGLYASVTLLAHGDEEHEQGDDHGGAAQGGDDHDDTAAWTTLDRTGRLQWHDPRINYRAGGLPPQVTDESAETKVKDWRVPLVVAGEPGAILGTLTWVGEPGAGSAFPVAAVVSIAALLVLAVGAVVLVRRRRAAGGTGTEQAP